MNYAVIKKNDIANGVGVRVSLFVSGCRHRCKNCFNSEAWDFKYGREFSDDTVNEIISALDHSYVRGLSILGGEPFEPENQSEVLRLVRTVREKLPEKDIWCYTGFLFEDLQSGTVGKHCAEILKHIDVLVDGKFVEELKNASLLFRGSSNQRIIDVQKSLDKKSVVLSDGKWERKMGSVNIEDA